MKTEYPTDLRENLRFRALIKDQKGLWDRCAEDILFYTNSFIWTYDPRKPQPVIPFITWEFQDSTMLDLVHAIECGEDRLIEKSRDMGASWMLLLVFEWLWHFRDMQSFLLVSRKEDLVDKSGDPKSLFWKIDFIHKHLPEWLMPNVNRIKLHLVNLDNGSTIDGESTTGDVARGDRRTAIGLDEFAAVDNGEAVLASTADATNCRLFNSTPKGSGNAYYDVRMKGDTKVITLHWAKHPEKADGLEFVNGKPTSPWYRRECKRRTHPMEIAQELDINYLGSDFQFFDPEMLDKYRKEFCRPPMQTGEFDYVWQECDPVGLTDHSRGRLSLWISLEVGRPSPEFNYAMGVDIATGTGSSNSVLSVACIETKEKVAEWCCPNTRPEELARLAVSMCRWFKGKDGRGAFMVPEANGPGRNFIDAVLEQGFRNIYYRENERSITKDISNVPGWYATKESKLSLLGDYRRALSDQNFINRSEHAIKECGEIIFNQNGGVTHSRARGTADPSGARDNHGDRPTADALAWKGVKGEKPKVDLTPSVEQGSFMWRRQRAEERLLANDGWASSESW